MKNFKLPIIFIMIMLLTFFSLTVLSFGQEKKVIKIGMLLPLTGFQAADGEESLRGAQLAVDEINSSGGVLGYKFEIVAGDVRDEVPDVVVSTFKKITSDKEVKVMMSQNASRTNFEINLMAEINMPYLLSANSAQTETIIAGKPENYPTVFSMSPSYDAYETELPRIVELWAEQGKLTLKNRKVAIITSDNPYSRTISEGLKKSFPKYGWTITVDKMVPFVEIYDWRAILSEIRKDPPDLIVNTDDRTSNEITFIDQFLESPTKSLLFIQYGPSVPEFIELLADKSTGIIYNLLGGNIPTSLIAQKVAAKFKAKYNVESGVYGHVQYWSVYVYAEALKKVGDPDKFLEIGKALGQTDLEISSGRLKFDPETHLAIQGDDYLPITFYQIWDGKRYLLFPEKYANGEFQSPPWMK